MIFGGVPALRDRNTAMLARFDRMAGRSTRASVGRITARSRPAVRQVLEPGVFLDERELRGADRAVALLADDDLGGPLGALVRLAVGVAVLLLPEDEHHDVGILFEGAGLAKIRELRTMVR